MGGTGKMQREAGATGQVAEDEAPPDGCGDGEEGMAYHQASTGPHLHPQPCGEYKKNT